MKINCAFANNKFNWMNSREYKESIHLLVFKYCIAFVVFVLRSVCMATEEHLNIYLIPTLHFDNVVRFCIATISNDFVHCVIRCSLRNSFPP